MAQVERLEVCFTNVPGASSDTRSGGRQARARDLQDEGFCAWHMDVSEALVVCRCVGVW